MRNLSKIFVLLLIGFIAFSCETPSSSGVEVPADTTAPAEATGLVSTAGNTLVNLGWTNPTDSDLAGVIIYNGDTEVIDITNGDTSYSVTGLTNDTAYTFTIVTYDASGNDSAGTDFPAATPKETIVLDETAPGEATVVSAIAGESVVTLTWTAPSDSDLAGFFISNDVNSDVIDVDDATVTTKEVTGLTNGTAYTFTIKTYDGETVANVSSGVDFAAATPVDSTAPNAVTAVAATDGDTESVVSWTASTSSDVATVTVSVSPADISAVVISDGSTTTTLTGLTNDITYTVSVVATDGAGNSSTAATATCTPAAAVVIPTPIHNWGFTFDALPSGTSGTIIIDDDGSESANFQLKESGFDYATSTDGAYISGVDSADETANGAIKANFTTSAWGYYYNSATAGVGINTIDITSESFTVEAVIKADAVSGYSDDVALVEFYDSTAGSGWKLYLEKDDASIKMKTMAGVDTSDLDGDGSTTDTLSNECKTASAFNAVVDTWYHIVAVYDIDTTDYGTYGGVFIYINGELIATKDANYPLVQNSATDKLIVGGGSTGSNKNFNGSFDNVAIWEGALSAEQIDARAAEFNL